MKVELLPCVCGGKAEIASHNDIPMHCVYCKSCGTITPYRNKKNDAIEEWNRLYGQSNPSEAAAARIKSLEAELEEYKATGLTPAEVTSYKKLFDSIDPSSGLPDGVMAFDRLRTLVKADKKGLCEIMPCKKGDTLYAPYDTGEGKWDIEELTVVKINSERVTYDDNGDDDTSEIGKTLFLTPSEAKQYCRKQEQKQAEERDDDAD